MTIDDEATDRKDGRRRRGESCLGRSAIFVCLLSSLVCGSSAETGVRRTAARVRAWSLVVVVIEIKRVVCEGQIGTHHDPGDHCRLRRHRRPDPPLSRAVPAPAVPHSSHRTTDTPRTPLRSSGIDPATSGDAAPTHRKSNTRRTRLPARKPNSRRTPLSARSPCTRRNRGCTR
ncbi:hypothetical protein DFJ73DRAFT_375429 [Zopfochytrium polystomum]|nr:hypothetical protein DFJ73DRAFT_375429 [Zopfochytrium polystomum]